MVTIYTKIVIDMNTMQTVYAESFEYSGSVALCGGSSGGTSGKVSFPTHMQDLHDYWLRGGAYSSSDITGGITVVMDDAKTSAGGNPFDGAYVYNPEADLDDIQTRYDTFNTAVAKLDVFADWEKMLETAQDGMQGTALSDNEIEDAVTQFETEQRLTHARATSRFNAGMADINAVTSSAFTVGNALLETELSRAVAKYRADLNYNVQQQKYTFVLQSISAIGQLLATQLNIEQSATRLQFEINQIKTAFTNAYLDADLKLNVEDASWDLELYQYGANLLGSIGGGTMVPRVKQPALWQQMMLKMTPETRINIGSS